MELFLVENDPSNPLVRSRTDNSSADTPTFTRSDAGRWRIHHLRKNPDGTYGNGSVPDTLRIGMGIIDALPDSGTYTLTGPNGGTTAAIARNADATTIQAALRAGWTLGTDIVVTLFSVGHYEIDWGNTGAEAGTPTATPDGLVPSGSTVSVVNTQDGTSLLNEKWEVRLHKAYPFLNTAWSTSPGVTTAGATLVNGSATASEVISMTWNSDAFGGATWWAVSTQAAAADLATVGPIAYNATAAEVKAALNLHPSLDGVDAEKVQVDQGGPGSYTITFDKSFGAHPSIGASAVAETLVVPVWSEADIAVSTAGSNAILGTSEEADVKFEIEFSATAGAPSTLVRLPTKLYKDLLGNSPGYQTGGDYFLNGSNIRNLSISTDVKGIGITTSYNLGASNPLFYGAFSNSNWLGDFIAFYNNSAAKVFSVEEDGNILAPSLSDPLSSASFSFVGGAVQVNASQLSLLAGKVQVAADSAAGFYFAFGTNGYAWDATEGAYFTSSSSFIVQIDNDSNQSNESFAIYTGSATARGGTKLFEVTINRVQSELPVRLKGYTVGTLPTGSVGDTAYVTDATAPTYLGALTGGGAVTCPVFHNGSAWVSN